MLMAENPSTGPMPLADDTHRAAVTRSASGKRAERPSSRLEEDAPGASPAVLSERMWERCDLAGCRRGHLGQDCSPRPGPAPEGAGFKAMARAWLPGSGAAGEQLVVGAGLYRGRCAGGVNCRAQARPRAGSGRSPARTRDSAPARARGSSAGTTTPRPSPRVRARPSTAVPTTGTPDPRPARRFATTTPRVRRRRARWPVRCRGPAHRTIPADARARISRVSGPRSGPSPTR
jgi:hypothetical protein